MPCAKPNHPLSSCTAKYGEIFRTLCYPGFECCISDVLWDGGGSLKELAMFYRFKKEIYPENSVQVVAENSSVYGGYQERQYSAEAFYEWMNTRKNKLQYTSFSCWGTAVLTSR